MNEKQLKELEALVKDVVDKRDRIIPVIGDDAFEGRVVVDDISYCFPLQRWLAERVLGEETSIEVKEKIHSEGYRGLDILHDEYRRINPDDSFRDYLENVVSIIESGIQSRSLYLRKDVKDFLLAGKFEVIATTCPYHILEYEIDGYNMSGFAPMSARSNSSSGSKAEDSLSLPSIYQIFGDCKGEFVSGEEDLLKFLHYLNQTSVEKGYGASPLVKYIKDKGQDNQGLGLLMPIGCNNLPNWLFRFLWYPFSQDCLIGKDKNNRGGVWYKHSSDERFYKFLKRYQFRTFSGPIDDLYKSSTDEDPILLRITEEFARREHELHQYIASNLQVTPSEDGHWDIFISYAKEDEQIVKNIYDILTKKCNKKVWMAVSGNIKPGDDYWDAIWHGIEHSSRFLFFITETYLSKALVKNRKDEAGYGGPTGVYKEIELIIRHLVNRREDGQRGLSIPLIWEGTKVSYTDNLGKFHNNELLQSGVLETLPRFKEYEMLQTDKLFFQIQDLICNEENLEVNLIDVFNS